MRRPSQEPAEPSDWLATQRAESSADPLRLQLPAPSCIRKIPLYALPNIFRLVRADKPEPRFQVLKQRNRTASLAHGEGVTGPGSVNADFCSQADSLEECQLGATSRASERSTQYRASR